VALAGRGASGGGANEAATAASLVPRDVSAIDGSAPLLGRLTAMVRRGGPLADERKPPEVRDGSEHETGVAGSGSVGGGSDEVGGGDGARARRAALLGGDTANAAVRPLVGARALLGIEIGREEEELEVWSRAECGRATTAPVATTLVVVPELEVVDCSAETGGSGATGGESGR